jgi:hypothetical protein
MSVPPPATQHDTPKLALLFWFYDHVDVCINRLDLLRRLNPGIAIYGLFGGPPSLAAEFEQALSSRLDHYYAFPQDRPPSWKWEHGDILISQWFRDCGRDLDWDTIIVAQWDMLILKPLRQVFAALRKDEIFVSSTRPVREVEKTWFWVRPPNEPLRNRYIRFLEHLKTISTKSVEPLASIFLIVCLPRVFLEKYSRIAMPELGFIEYRVPTYARLFGVSNCDRLNLDAWSPDESHAFRGHKKYLIPVKMPIPLLDIYLAQLRRRGPAIFHPYYRIFRPGVGGMVLDFASVIRDVPNFLRFRKNTFTSIFSRRG